jgi:ferrochelatase
MRYGTPSIHEVLDHLHEKHTTEIKIIPLFPQYSATTTASIQDEICRWQMKQRRLPSIKFLNTYHDDENYINALAKSIEKAMPQQLESHQHLLFSFHGIPQRNLNLGDHYHCLCQKTARLVAEKLGLQKETQYSVSFQSRLGKATWLKPYTTDVLNTLPQQGKTELFVVCPAFTSDCLETLEEIDMEGKEDFLHAGGQKYHYIPALNEDDLWIETLYQLSKKL